MAASKNKYGFIVNTKSGRGSVKRKIKLIEEFCSLNNIKYEIYYTEYPKHATSLTERCVREGFEIIVAVGGDGTSHEIANALISTDSVLGILPSGSGNDFPKSVDVPLDFRNALKNLLEFNIKEVDVGYIKDRFFINGIGFGMDGAVAQRFKKYSLIRGELAYIWGAVIEALTFPGFRAEIAIPGWRFTGDILLAGASNGSYHGGKFQLAPSAKVDDGFLDVYVIKNMPTLSRLIQIPKVLTGKHVFMDEVYIKSSPFMEVTVEKPVPAHMDGEPFILGPGYHKIEIKNKALKVLSSK
jgi:YegS/Rv2252/BmrU family lipid kinase